MGAPSLTRCFTTHPHRQPHDILGEADLGGVPFLDDVAWDFDELLDVLVAGEAFQRGEAAASGDDLELAALAGSDLQVLQQAVRLDAGGKLGDAGGGSGLADIGGGRDQL